jgi:hypothetical protein
LVDNTKHIHDKAIKMFIISILLFNKLIEIN